MIESPSHVPSDTSHTTRLSYRRAEEIFEEITRLLANPLARPEPTSSPRNRSALPEDGRVRRYLLVGLIRCRPCGRIMDSHWVNNHAGYRCRHGNRSATPADSGQPRNVYVHEDKVITHAAAQLGMATNGSQAIVNYLRAHNIIITCAAGGAVTLDHILTTAERKVTVIPQPAVRGALARSPSLRSN
jgi:hypothetical protein